VLSRRSISRCLSIFIFSTLRFGATIATDLHSLLLAFGIQTSLWSTKFRKHSFKSSVLEMARNPQVAFNSLRDFMTNFPLQNHRFFTPPPPQFFPGEQLERQYKAHIATLAGRNWSCHWLDESALAEWISEQPKISYDPVRDLYLAQQGKFVPFIQYNGDIGRVSLPIVSCGRLNGSVISRRIWQLPS